jgi:hypothetical protein
MNNKSTDIQELSVAELFQQDEYIIPIYQRNYAWGEPEVEQLLQDILDVSTQHEIKSTYYIGSLVVHERSAGIFETIDGQQRHTTLGVILSVLKHKLPTELTRITKVNLGFDSRPKSARTLKELFIDPSRISDEPGEINIRSAYEVAMKFLYNLNEENISEFTNYLLNNVKILRVTVPRDTDLNHYFEIMNNRGEQLEKHEVLKARLMSELKNNNERNTFASVWDACSEMGRYAQLGIPSSARLLAFGSDWNVFPNNFDKLCELIKSKGKDKLSQSMAEIISTKTPYAEETSTATDSVQPGTFNSIINYSNFLLHVLRITTRKDVPLDDKRLLDTFSEYKPNPQKFALDLLKIRMLFDRYIIKRENEEDWSLNILKPYNKGFSYVNSFGNEKLNQRLIMLISMFHVSFPTLVYKHWLSAALSYLYEKTSGKQDIEALDYIEHLEKISDRFFYGRFGIFSADSGPIDYYRLTFSTVDNLPNQLDDTHLKKGTGVQNFIFNRLDYLLWKHLKDDKRFAGVNEDYVRRRLSEFCFTFRTSVEHYFPQNPLGSNPLKSSEELPIGVDTFGNLCLISRSNNSKLSNYLPTAKKEHYEKATSVESLKQVFMMSYDQWGPDSNQSINNIAAHEKMMVDVLSDSFN